MKSKKKRRKREYSVFYPGGVSPLAPPETQRAIWAVTAFTQFFTLLKEGISPSAFGPKAWYDRVIWVVGGFLLLAVFGGGMVMMILDRIHGR